MHLPVSRRRVPAAHSQDLQALHRLVEGLDEQDLEFKFISAKDTRGSTVLADLISKRLFEDVVLHLPVLVLWLERHQRAVFAPGQNVLWGGTVNLLELVASFLTLATICSIKQEEDMFPHHM